MRIQHNIMAMNSYRNYNNNTNKLGKNLEKLSSGYKINRAGDDAAGLAISEKMRAQITGLKQAQDNAKSGINLVQTAEGAMQEVHDMLNRMVKLADQSANGTYDNEVDRANLQKEVNQLKDEIDRISKASNFNGTNLLDGSLGGREVTIAAVANGVQGISLSGGGKGAMPEQLKVTLDANDLTASKLENATAVDGITWKLDEEASTISADGKSNLVFKAVVAEETATAENAAIYKGMTATVQVDAPKAADGTYVATAATSTAISDPKGLTLQIGDTSDDFNQLTVTIGAMDTKSLGIDVVDISNQESAADAVDLIKEAINKVSSTRGDLGAAQNRLDHTINNLSVMTENIQDAEANIRDTDVAAEMMEYTKNNILIQSAQAMLAQANQVPQGVLQLLQ